MATLSPDSISWSIEHLARYSDTDIFPRLFEFQAIRHCRDEVIKWLTNQDICQWSTRPLRRCLVPKQKYDFRIATQLDPLDMVFYLALCLEVGDQVEHHRIPTNQNIAFSNRFSKDDKNTLMFDRNIGYAEFQEHSRDLIEKSDFVVTADIADFYPRIYLHDLDHALTSSMKSTPTHARAISQLLKGWNQTKSYGIPVGNNPSRLFAELLLDDVDRMLLANGAVFCRYVDDYRIFCNSRQLAYQYLILLANTLYNSHGLTLQPQKTKILSSDNFVNDVLETEERKELQSLTDGFEEIASQLGLDNPYQPIEYDDLAPEFRKQIDGLNLESLLIKQLKSESMDISMMRFLISRLGQLKRTGPLDNLLIDIDKIYPVFAEFVRYLAQVTDIIRPDGREKVGGFLLGKLQNSVVSHLEFHRMLIMSLFAGGREWGNADKLAGYYDVIPDDWFRRCLIIALGKAGQDYWLRAKKPSVENMPPWQKRAFIYAASCFENDEMKHWYYAIRPRLDNLEKYIVTWASNSRASA